MPGNEVGDKVHNFFGQENLYQGPHQLQAADGNWPMLTDNTWVGSQQHFGGPFISNLKNNSAHQSANSEGVGHVNLASDGFSHTQSNLWPDFNRSQAHNQQKTFNGFVQGDHMFQTRQNEANFLAGRMVSDRKLLTTRDLTLQEAQSLGGPDLNEKNFMGLETSDAHVSFDLFGGQQQMNGGHVNMMQSLRRQQSGMSDSQLMQQQAILSQIEGLQRQQQPQFESRHHGSVIMRQDSGNHSSAIGGNVSVDDNLNYSWQHEHMADTVNWPQFGASPVMHVSSSGLVLASEQNHALQMMGLVNQQIDQSPYGVHHTVRSISGPNSSTQMDKPAIQQLSSPYNSFPLNQYTAFPNQSDMQDENSFMRQKLQGKSLFEQTITQGLNNRLNSENLNPVNSQQGNIAMLESQGKRPLARQSETSPEKTEMQVTSSQYVATLDPTEEKILYGSDDSLWDVFGRTPTLGSGVSNTLDGVVFDSGFSSLQSGKWSALMQSAVAETLTGTSGVQEEWSGLSFRNAESPNENQHHVSVDAVKHLTSINYRDASGFKQTRPKSSFQKHDESSQTYAAQIPYCAEEESRCLDRSLIQKLPAEGLRVSENVNNSSGAEIKANNIVGSWTSQHSIPVNQRGKQNGGNFMGSPSPGKNGNLKYHENQNMPPNPQGSDYRRVINEEMGHSTFMFKDDAASNSHVEMLCAERAIELPQLSQIYNESKVVNGDAAGPQSSNFSSERESRQQYSHSGRHNIGKCVDSLGKRGHSSVDKYQHHLDNSSQILESFGNGGLNKGESETLKMQESKRKENFKDGSNSSISNHTSTGGLGWSDVKEGRKLTVGKQKSTINVVRRSSTACKFQYHPMGDLEVDAEPSNGTGRFAHSQASSQEQIYVYKSHDTGSTGQSKLGHADKSFLEVGKGNEPTRGFGETPSNRMLTGFVPNKDASLDNFVGNDPSHNLTPSSQNMLELLHKVDHPREHGATTNCSPSNFNPSSRMFGAKNSDGPIDQTQPCQSSVSHGFGLQLGPPSQPPSMSDTALSSHESFDSDKISPLTTSEIKGKVISWLAPATSMKSFTPHVSLRNHVPCASESLHSGGHLQAKNKMKNWHPRQIDEFSNRVETSHSSFMPDDSEILPHPKIDASRMQNSAQQSDWLTTSQQGAFSKVSSNERLSVTNPQQCSEPLKFSHIFKSFQLDNNLESELSKLKVLNQDTEELVSSPSGVHSVNLQSFVGKEKPVKESHRKWVSSANSPLSSLSTLQGKETLELPDPASANPASNKKDYEALGHSLRPNNTSDQHFLSLDQMLNINAQIDLTEKRFKSVDSSLDTSEIAARGGQSLSSGLNTIVQKASFNLASLSPGDSKIQTFPSQPGDSPNASGLCKDGLVFCQSKSENLSNISCDKGEHSGISPQMAPAWFDGYGSFKNDQIFTVPAQGNSTVKSLNQSLIEITPSDSLSSLHALKQPSSLIEKVLPDSAAKSSPMSVKELCRTGSDLLPSAVANQSLVVRPQKRKTSTSELLPWHKELALDSHRLQNISLADVEWAQAAHQLIEKREDDLEMVDDGEVFFRAKKRHASTTQLMQQLLRPPPATFLSTAANLEYESGVYLIARSASGDACSALSTAGTKTDSNHMSGKLKSSVETGDKLLHKLVEDFIGRAKKLEKDFLRVDKGVSILDLRVGCQDLEKFSVVNRFAKFHSRGQVDGREASSFNTAANSQKICPQRYVTVVPMPRNLPDRVQCLSL